MEHNFVALQEDTRIDTGEAQVVKCEPNIATDEVLQRIAKIGLPLDQPYFDNYLEDPARRLARRTHPTLSPGLALERPTIVVELLLVTRSGQLPPTIPVNAGDAKHLSESCRTLAP